MKADGTMMHSPGEIPIGTTLALRGASMGRRAGDFSVKSLRRLNVGFYNLGNGRMIHQWQLIPKAMPAMVREDSLTEMRIPYEY